MVANFKNILLAVSLTLAGLLLLTALPSCNRDKCKTVVCANGGVCNGGNCTCPVGYEGSQCETASRDKFLGTWTVFEKGNTTPAAQYTVTVEAGTNIADVYFKNFNNYFNAQYVTGYVSGDTLWVPTQSVQGKWVIGIGAITQNATYAQNDYMLFVYEVTDTTTGIVNDYGYNTAADNSGPSQWNK